jgi:hypothetical protein
VRPDESVAGGPIQGRRCPRWVFAFEQIHPALGGLGGAPLARAEQEPVEVMAHPAHEGQLDALLDHTWREMISGFAVGSYGSL